MRTHSLAPGVAPLSELVFGAASLGGRVAPAEGLRALDAALARGVTGVDLARSYGYGEAEALIGKHLSGRRERVVLCTKAGIDPPRTGPLARRAKALLRPVLDKVGGLRARLVDALAPRPSAAPLEARALIASLETSLAALGTDRVDIFLAHRCPASPAEYDEVAAACEHARARGLLHLWGVSGTVAAIRAVTAHAPPPVVQIPGDPFSEAPPPGLARTLVMRFQPFGGGQAFARLVALAPELPAAERARWATEVSLRGPLVSAAQPTVVVCAMNQLAHVHSNTDVVLRPMLDDAALAAHLQRIRTAR